jgi:predicted N-acetyltransferase YhbS
MEIRTVASDEHTDFLALVDAEIRPAGAATRAADDFPLILGPENRDGQLVAVEDGRLLGCLAFLVRPFTTTWGTLPVAGVGSVVTRPEARGCGVSRRLQEAALVRLRRQDVPLAVLWTDRPEIYAGRGFRPAGVEYHVDLTRAELGAPPPWLRVVPFTPDRAAVVAEIYADHPLRTLRRSGDAEQLYAMRGTRGRLALDADGIVLAHVFCGKGADFPGYVLEWGGDREVVLALLGQAAAEGLARHVLVPQGGEDLVDRLVDCGGAWFAQPSGCWSVVQPAALARRGREHGWVPPEGADLGEPGLWLGRVGADGQPEPGPLGVAVWGFDSV